MIQMKSNYWGQPTNYVSLTLMDKMRDFGIAEDLALRPDYYFLFQITNDMTEYEKLFMPYTSIGPTGYSGDLNEGTSIANRFQDFSIIVDYGYSGSNREYDGHLSFTGSEALTPANTNSQWTYNVWAISQDANPRPEWNGGTPSGTMLIPYGPTASFLLETGRLILTYQ